MRSPDLLRGAASVGGVTMLSRVLGFVRDVVIARAFGAGDAADAFFVAFRLPNFLRRLFAEGAFSQAFVPVLAQEAEQHGQARAREFFARVYGALLLVVLAVTVLAVAGAPVLVYAFAPGFADEPQRFALTVDLLRWTFPYILFISLAAAAAGVLNTYGRYAVPAFTPVLLNLSLIGCALLLAPELEQPVMALGVGVALGGMAQLAWQLPALARLGLLPAPRFGFRHADVRRVVRLMIPATFGASVQQIGLLFDTILASFLAAGSVSWLYYSDRLLEFPLGVFGIAIATVILPGLSRHHSAARHEDFRATLDWGVRWVLLIGVPATVGLVVLAGPMLVTLFQYGAFAVQDVHMARLSLWAYAPGLLGFMLVKVLAPGFFSRQDVRTPVRIAIIAVGANMTLNLVFIVPLQHAGLALATSLSAYVNALLLGVALHRRGIWSPAPGWGSFLLRLAAAAAAMGAALLLGVGDLETWVARSPLERGLWLALWVGTGMVAFAASAWLLRLPLQMLRAPAPRADSPRP